MDSRRAVPRHETRRAPDSQGPGSCVDRTSDLSKPFERTRRRGHSLALELAGIDRTTRDPRGGSFDRDDQGIPNGVLRESAKALVREAGPARPQPTRSERLAGLKRQFTEYVRHGITSIQIAGTSASTLSDYQAVQAAGPPVRIYAMLRIRELDRARQLRERPEFNSEFIKLGGIKHFHGNSLSGRTCWLYEPYADRPDYYGIPPKASQEEINEAVWRIHDAGMQACIHCNGDREIDMVLDAIDEALKRRPRSDHRHRLEHASVVSPSILNRIKKLGVVLALHSYVYEHGDKMEAYGESRWPWMHANRSALDMRIPVAGNSDLTSQCRKAAVANSKHGDARLGRRQGLRSNTTCFVGSGIRDLDGRQRICIVR